MSNLSTVPDHIRMNQFFAHTLLDVANAAPELSDFQIAQRLEQVGVMIEAAREQRLIDRHEYHRLVEDHHLLSLELH